MKPPEMTLHYWLTRRIWTGSWIPRLIVVLQPFYMSLFVLFHPSVRYKTFFRFVRWRQSQKRLLMNLLRAGLHNTLLYKTQVLIKVEVRSNLQTSHFLTKISPIWPETYLLLMKGAGSRNFSLNQLILCNRLFMYKNILLKFFICLNLGLLPDSATCL